MRGFPQFPSRPGNHPMVCLLESSWSVGLWNRVHMQVMPYAKMRTKVSDDERSRYGQDNDEDADDTRRLWIANGDRRQLESHERPSHGIAGRKQDNGADAADAGAEAADCQ